LTNQINGVIIYTKEMHMHLSNQAIGAVMMALQKSLMDQSDIVPVFQGFVFKETAAGLVVENPPTVKFKNEAEEEEEQTDAEV
jgi:hypothetical protein